MKIVSITLVRNESDIIELFIRHTLNFVDEMYIIENLSSDNTQEILNNLKNEGLPIILMKSAAKNHPVSQTMLTMISRLKDKDIDYIFPIDADEFLSCNSREELEEDLLSIPKNSIGSVRWKTYLPSSTNVSNVLLECKECCEEEPFDINKMVIPKDLFDGIYFYPGAHDKAVEFNKEPCPKFIIKTRLCHFPIRSINQAIQKFMFAYHTISRRPDCVGTDNGFQNKTILDQLRECDYQPSLELFRSFVYNYGQNFSNLNVVIDPMIVKDNVSIKFDRKSSLMYNIDIFMSTI